MKNYLAIIYALFTLFFTGCDEAKNSAREDNRVYFKDADFNKTRAVFIENSITKLALPINLTQKTEKEVKVYVEFSQEVLNEYNLKNKKNYKAYPEDLWSLENKSVSIPSGTSVGSIEIVVNPFRDAEKESGDIYAIPFKITSVDGASIINGAESLIYVLKQVPYANVPLLTKQSGQVVLKWNEGDLILNDFTVEFLLYINSWKNGNNKALFYAQGGSSNNTQIYTRLENGGRGIKDAVYEVNLGAPGFLNSTPSGGKFEVGKWYHIAFGVSESSKLTIYIDGIQVAQRDITPTPITLKLNMPSGSYFRFSNGNIPDIKVSELRLWNISRTQEQISENMYSVNPNTEGLIAYWKFNEGSGSNFKDYTEKNDDAQTQLADPTWSLEERIEVK